MIQNFRHKGLAKLYEKGDRKALPVNLLPKVERVLARLDIATEPKMMDLPGLRLHALKGELQDFWAVSVSGNWRIIFRFKGSNATDVDFVDYH